jgi:hypothetical protein
VDFTTAFDSSRAVTVTSISGSAGNTTLTIPQMPSHDHKYPGFNPPAPLAYGHTGYGPNITPNVHPVTSTGGGGSHNHPFSFSSGSGTVDLAVKYLDVITATKN